MKTKDNLLKGIIMGIGMIVLPLILMSTTNTNTENEIGRYQISTCSWTGQGSSIGVYETIIDTKTGKIISREDKTNYSY